MPKDDLRFYLYVMMDRQGIVNQNIQKIEMLKNQLDFDINYQKGLEALTEVKKKYNSIEQKMKENTIRYKIGIENKNIIVSSNQIQILTERIMEKEKKIGFIKLMLELLEKKSALNPFAAFLKFYKKNKQVVQEELDETTSIGGQFIEFAYLFHTILKEQKQQPKMNMTLYERLSILLEHYQITQNALQIEKNNKEELLQQDRQFKRNYSQMQKKLQSDKNTAYLLIQQLTQYIEKANRERSCKQNEIMKLEQENYKYQKEIDDLRQIFMNTNDFVESAPIISNDKQYKMGSLLMDVHHKHLSLI